MVQRYGSGISFLYRYLNEINLTWAQELCIYMFVWMAKFGAAYGVRTGIHVGVDVLVNMLRPRIAQGHPVRPVLRGVVHGDRRHAWARKFVSGSCDTDQASPDLEMPSWIVYLVHPARLLSDVLPLPAGRVGLLAHRRTAASRSGHVEGVERREPRRPAGGGARR